MLQNFKEKSFADRGGNRMKADEVIAEVVKLCKSFGANEVVLYGSRAKGTSVSCSMHEV